MRCLNMRRDPDTFILWIGLNLEGPPGRVLWGNIFRLRCVRLIPLQSGDDWFLFLAPKFEPFHCAPRDFWMIGNECCVLLLQTRLSSSGKCRRETSGRKGTTWKRTADCSRTPAPSILCVSPSCVRWSWWSRHHPGGSSPTHTPTTSTPSRSILTGRHTCPPMICGKQDISQSDHMKHCWYLWTRTFLCPRDQTAVLQSTLVEFDRVKDRLLKGRFECSWFQSYYTQRMHFSMANQ